MCGNPGRAYCDIVRNHSKRKSHMLHINIRRGESSMKSSPKSVFVVCLSLLFALLAVADPYCEFPVEAGDERTAD